MLLSHLLNRLIRVGSLCVVDANGIPHRFHGTDGPNVTIRLHDKRLHYRLFINPRLALGEAYTNGELTIEDASLYDFLDLIGRNMQYINDIDLGGMTGFLDRLVRRLQQINTERLAKAHVAHHYDLSEELYDLFLDRDKQYSCAYFDDNTVTLEQAQENKKRHIAAKLLPQRGQRILDIGCGWGGLAMHLAQESGAVVTGLTLSQEQVQNAQARVREAGLDKNVDIQLRDYRQQTGQFDRIVSVGMFEHVGVAYYKSFFSQVDQLLKDDGVALIHTIGRTQGPGVTDPWIRKYIFPGGYIPALSEIVPVIEKTGLMVTDVEILRLHYAETLKHWRQRFNANRGRIAALYDDRFCRMWEYYLASSEIAFRYLSTAVFQIQLAKQQTAVPMTRDYIQELESAAGEPEHRSSSRAA